MLAVIWKTDWESKDQVCKWTLTMYYDLHSASMMRRQMMYDRGGRLYEAHGKIIITGHVTLCLANHMVSSSGNSH